MAVFINRGGSPVIVHYIRVGAIRADCLDNPAHGIIIDGCLGTVGIDRIYCVHRAAGKKGKVFFLRQAPGIVLSLAAGDKLSWGFGFGFCLNQTP